MRKSSTLALMAAILATVSVAQAANVPEAIQVSPDGHSFVTASGKPWFWQADTAWCIFNHPSPADVDLYLNDRASKGFNVVQGCVAVWDYRTRKNPDGEVPFVNGDPAHINDAYFKNVDSVIDKVEARGMYMAVLPFWTKNTRSGPAADPETMKAYCHYLAKRYAAKNIFWVLGGDTAATQIQPVINAEAAGLQEGAKEAGVSKIMITYHPTGRESSSFWFQDSPWLDFNAIQSGHFIDTTNFQLVGNDFVKKPVKPTLDMEPGYENITDRLVRDNPDAKRIQAVDVRRSAYLAVFAGAAGHSYGNGEVYEFYHPMPGGAPGAGWHANMDWKDALKLPASGQIQFVRDLILSRPAIGRMPDQSLLAAPASNRAVERIEALRGADNSYAFVYLPAGIHEVTVNTGKLTGNQLKTWWYDPRTGKATAGETLAKTDTKAFTSPAGPAGNDDWVLVLDDAAKNYPAPGTHQ
ncbi:MAG TPA: glycoside hydrolase family 140 protein [Phycisphaerae bacterium]|nr:glycoside hydrolase family 140 protein [Phycisphaerae bacterium]